MVFPFLGRSCRSPITRSSCTRANSRFVQFVLSRRSQSPPRICSNVQSAFVPAGKKKGCRSTSSDTAVLTGPDTIRYPDVMVDCGPLNASAMTAFKPNLIVEVSSPGTAVFDYQDKLREYQGLKSVDPVI
ncbi:MULTISPECIES: Uma2 family endonuclease [unclassified Bradyrhizobium]